MAIPLSYWWKLDDGSGTVAADSVDSRPGTLVNSPTWITGTPYGGGLAFNGLTGTAANYVRVGDLGTYWFQPGISGQSEFILAVRFRTSSGNGAALVQKSNIRFSPAYGHDNNFYVGTDGKLRYSTVSTSTLPPTPFTVTSPNRVDDGKWHSAAVHFCNYDYPEVPVATKYESLWLDGEQVDVSPNNAAAGSGAGGDGLLYIGGLDMRNLQSIVWPAGANAIIAFNGDIADVRYYTATYAHPKLLPCDNDLSEITEPPIEEVINAIMFSCNT